MKRVAVIILHYMHREDTLDCIKSVLKSTYPEIKIFLVNNSEENFDDDLKDIKNLEYLPTGQNLGYTGGNNVGIKKALEEDFDFIFVLNPDTTIDKNAIEKLVEAAEKESGVYGPKIYFGDTGKKIWYAGGIFDKENVLGSHRGVDLEDKGQFDTISETDFITGAALFISREVLERVGSFDEKYFLYYEDSDFCFRAKRDGFKIMYIPDAVVYHENAKSTGLGSTLQDYYITRNRMLFASKFLSMRTQFALFREALRNFGNPVRKQAFVDFLFGNFGKGSYKNA